MRSPAYILFIVTLILAPLAFGSVETWSIGLLEFLVSLTALCYLFEIRKKETPFLSVPGIVPLGLLLLFIWLQLLPLPAGFVKIIAPAVHQAYAPILELQKTPQWIPLTVNQKATLLEALRISTYALFYILSIQLLSTKKRLLKTVQTVAGLATGIAFLAILQKFTSPDLIYWFRPVPDQVSPTGPWIYRNHYAGFMEMLFPIVLALFFYYRPHLKGKQKLRSRIVSLFSSPESNTHFFLGFSVILIFTSIFIGLSRGGIVSANLALLFFLFLLARRSSRSGTLLPLLLFSTILIAVTWFGWEPILERFNATTTKTGELAESRVLLWQACIPLIRDFFFTGSGFGTFINAFPQYNTLPTTAIFDHAHNDYIELITDGGIIALLLAGSFVITVFRHGLKKLFQRRETYSRLLIIACLTGIFAIMFHSITDFNMHNGANGLYFFFICGLLVSAGNTRLHFRSRPTLLKTVSPRWMAGLLLALPLLLLCIRTQTGILAAQRSFNKTAEVYLNPRLSPAIIKEQLAITDRAINADPLEGRYFSHRGRLHGYLSAREAALKDFLNAASKDPMEGTYLQQVALLLPKEQKKQATFLMTEGYRRSLNKEQLVFVLAEWYLQQDQRERALKILKQGLEQFREVNLAIPQFFLSYQFSREEISTILPPKAAAWIALGAFFQKAGQMEDSEYFRRGALTFLDREEKIKPSYFAQLYWFYKREKRTEDAVAVLKQGIEWLPDYAPFHIYLGDYYRQQKIHYRAKEEYEQALMLEPGNEKIRKRLQGLE